jgi:predicted transcriptional regulator
MDGRSNCVEQETIVTLTADIVAAHVANNSVAVGDVGMLVRAVFESLSNLTAPPPEAETKKAPAVSIRASVKPDYLICLACGRKQKTLRRHLQVAHSLSVDEYRNEYGLPRDYPIVAPEYSKRRGEMARAIGLGRKRNSGGTAPATSGARTKTAKKRSPNAT